MTDTLDRLTSALADRYTIERELGRGGMAVVYLAQDLKHERQVAVKVLRPELAASIGADRFQQEIKIAANLNHPHILPLLDSGESDGFLFFVMPYIEGESLRDKLAKEGELPIAEAVRILRDVVDALSHAHKHNVVHRDIKPDNVMLSDRHALVTDFGVAKAVSEATGRQKLTTEGIALGTPAYMSPEQAAADPHIDHRADIYAVGAVAYELLTGRPPFLGTTPQMILSAHMTDSPEPVTKYREAVPPALAALVMKCLEKKAADRWQSAEELLPQLEALVTPSGGTTPVGTVPVAAARRGWKVAAATGAVAVILAVILVLTWIPQGSSVTLDPDRVLVAVFENQTGDPTLDPLGAMAGHWITQGLQQSGLVQVVPWLEAQQASRYVASQVDSGNVRSPVTALAEETGAGTVISGAYYRRGETVQYQVEVTDVIGGQSLGALAPESAPMTSPDDAIEPLRQRVMGFLAVSFDEHLASESRHVSEPPTLEAYQAFDEGMQWYLRNTQDDYRSASRYFAEAFQLDSTFVIPLLYAVLCHNNVGQAAQADSLVQVLERSRDRLSMYERHWLDYLKARVEGDLQGALNAIRRAAELAPGSKSLYNLAYLARFNNRPQEAIDALLTLDPTRGPMRGWGPYWFHLIESYVDLGAYHQALEALRRARALHKDYREYDEAEASALAGLGKLDELNSFLGQVAPATGALRLDLFVRTATYLRKHGYRDAAADVIHQSVRRFESRPRESVTGNDRWWYARALCDAGRWDDAYRVVEQLLENTPDDVFARGLLGMIAAGMGDRALAENTSAWLEDLDRPYLYGRDAWWRAVIAATLGERDMAVALLQEAYSEGYPSEHNTYLVWFEPLRDYPPFQELMRPKG